jgi:hypothetical protein
LLFHIAVEISQRLSTLGPKGFATALHPNDPVEPEDSEIVTQRAPGDKRLHLVPKPEGQAANDALGRPHLNVAVLKDQATLTLHGRADLVDTCAHLRRHPRSDGVDFHRWARSRSASGRPDSILTSASSAARAIALTLRIVLPWSAAADPARYAEVAQTLGMGEPVASPDFVAALGQCYDMLLRKVRLEPDLRGDGMGPDQTARLAAAAMAPENHPMAAANSRSLEPGDARQLAETILPR